MSCSFFEILSLNLICNFETVAIILSTLVRFNSDLIDAVFEKISSQENRTLRYENDLIKYSHSDSVHCTVTFFTGQSWLLCLQRKVAVSSCRGCRHSKTES